MRTAQGGALASSEAFRRIFLNGRFRGQNVTGVQRYSIEILRALDAIWPFDRTPPVLLVPKDVKADVPYRSITVRQAGRLQGHAWEQLELPLLSRGGLLVNVGNVGPIGVRRQIVLIHDAGVFSAPSSYSWKYRWWCKTLQYLLARNCATIITTTEFASGEISRNLHMPTEAIGVIGAGSDHIVHHDADSSVLARHGLIRGAYVLAVGSLAPHKNLSALGLAGEQLRALGYKLVITGSLDRRVFAGSAELPKAAYYIGRVSDAELRALYEAAACFVFPSFYEGFGLPVLEAMRCGCPVVSSAAGALREVCGEAAIFVDPGSPGAIAAAVRAVVTKPETANALRERGCARAANFTWERTAVNLLAQIEISDANFELRRGRRPPLPVVGPPP